MEEELSVPVWYSNGGMMVRRDALDPAHPESTYNYIKNVLGKDPEDYGYYCTVLEAEQVEFLRKIPTDALVRELNLREREIFNEEMYAGW